MPETTEKKRMKKEIAECNHCVNGLSETIEKIEDWTKAKQKNVGELKGVSLIVIILLII